MQLRRLSIGPILVLLAACGGEAPPAEPVQGELRAEVKPVMGPERSVLAFGDSLFAGYNVAQDESYPARLQAALRARGINAKVTNAGVSGDTSAAGRQRLGFTLDAQDPKPDLVILELGGNDLLRGLSPEETRANFVAMLDALKKRDIPVLLMGMRAPPNYGPEYRQAFDPIYPALAKEYGAALIPFWLESIYQDQSLFQQDRIHPTADGIEALVGATVEKVAGAIPEADE